MWHTLIIPEGLLALVPFAVSDMNIGRMEEFHDSASTPESI